MSGPPAPLQVDPDRQKLDTGYLVRASRDGKWDLVDVSELTFFSMMRWLRSRGGANAWAEDVVLTLLMYPHRANDYEPTDDPENLEL